MTADPVAGDQHLALSEKENRILDVVLAVLARDGIAAVKQGGVALGPIQVSVHESIDRSVARSEEIAFAR